MWYTNVAWQTSSATFFTFYYSCYNVEANIWKSTDFFYRNKLYFTGIIQHFIIFHYYTQHNLGTVLIFSHKIQNIIRNSRSRKETDEKSNNSSQNMTKENKDYKQKQKNFTKKIKRELSAFIWSFLYKFSVNKSMIFSEYQIFS